MRQLQVVLDAPHATLELEVMHAGDLEDPSIR